jgi:catechol 2,3-dioxygenase-like lactoylglutathione lyase family enzyme
VAEGQPPLLRYPVVQHAWFVTDLEASARRWARLTGAGPFCVTRGHLGERHTYRGLPFDVPLHYAFGQSGDTHVQLISQDNEAPSIYRDMYGPGQEGFHHIAMLVPEAELPEEMARFEAAGYPVASTLWSRAEVAYIDTRDAIGCFLEMHGDNDDIRGVFERFRSAHAGWDGVTDVIR